MIYDLIRELLDPESDFWDYYMYVQDRFIMKFLDLFW